MRRKVVLRTLLVIILIGFLQLIIYKKINQAGEQVISSFKTNFYYSTYSIVNNVNANLHGKGFDDNQLFICAKTKKEISFAFLNDDYCDCEDGSDEPLTSACLNSKFFCKLQVPLIDINPTLGIHYIYSSQVNDGIEDCCDGSDEWNNQTKVSNTCVKLLNKISTLHSNLKIGLEKKKNYIKEGKHFKNKLYGENGEFYTLSHACLYHISAGYEYKVCPFESVTQTKLDEKGGRGPVSFSLGKNNNRWIDKVTLVMSRGDSDNCPNQNNELKGRKSQLKFKCGAEDRVVTSYEPQPCLYIFEILTPAAC